MSDDIVDEIAVHCIQSFNNVSISLLQHGCYQQAITVLEDAIKEVKTILLLPTQAQPQSPPSLDGDNGNRPRPPQTNMMRNSRKLSSKLKVLMMYLTQTDVVSAKLHNPALGKSVHLSATSANLDAIEALLSGSVISITGTYLKVMGTSDRRRQDLILDLAILMHNLGLAYFSAAKTKINVQVRNLGFELARSVLLETIGILSTQSNADNVDFVSNIFLVSVHVLTETVVLFVELGINEEVERYHRELHQVKQVLLQYIRSSPNADVKKPAVPRTSQGQVPTVTTTLEPVSPSTSSTSAARACGSSAKICYDLSAVDDDDDALDGKYRCLTTGHSLKR